jgi:hypothetical protein
MQRQDEQAGGEPTPTPETAPNTPSEAAGAPAGNVAMAAPNMIGNLLGAGNSVSFFVNRSKGANFIESVGSTNIVNPKVADDNSPIPEDRFSFRYNYFHKAVSVTGASPAPPVFDTDLGGFRGAVTTKSYNVDQYTFSGEKTAFDGWASVEVRIPFSHTLAANQDLSYGRVTGIGTATDLNGVPLSPPAQALEVIDTPVNSLGSADTEFGNMTVILKSILCRSENWLTFSGGLAIGIPTADDTNVRVTDYLGDPQFNNVSIQRVRDFHVNNETWALSPFLAVLVTPTDRCFAQAFLQWDFPLNSSDVTFTETTPFVLNGPFPGARPGTVMPPFTTNTSVEEQILMHADLGIGYWLVRNPECRCLTGIAPTFELHYTTTLENADIVTLPRDPAFKTVVVGPNTVALQEPSAPTVGNLRNRVDILDMTFGTTFEFGRQATLAAAVAFPTRGGDDKTFDWEFQLQFNYYFGGPRRSPAPNF